MQGRTGHLDVRVAPRTLRGFGFAWQAVIACDQFFVCLMPQEDLGSDAPDSPSFAPDDESEEEDEV